MKGKEKKDIPVYREEGGGYGCQKGGVRLSKGGVTAIKKGGTRSGFLHLWSGCDRGADTVDYVPSMDTSRSRPLALKVFSALPLLCSCSGG